MVEQDYNYIQLIAGFSCKKSAVRNFDQERNDRAGVGGAVRVFRAEPYGWILIL